MNHCGTFHQLIANEKKCDDSICWESIFHIHPESVWRILTIERSLDSHLGLQSFPKWAEEEHQDPPRRHPPARPRHQHRRWVRRPEGAWSSMPACVPNSSNFTCTSLLRVGFAAVFENHKASNIPHMYSLHSWCGMATVVFFCIQVKHTHTHPNIRPLLALTPDSHWTQKRRESCSLPCITTASVSPIKGSILHRPSGLHKKHHCFFSLTLYIPTPKTPPLWRLLGCLRALHLSHSPIQDDDNYNVRKYNQICHLRHFTFIISHIAQAPLSDS